MNFLSSKMAKIIWCNGEKRRFNVTGRQYSKKKILFKKLYFFKLGITGPALLILIIQSIIPPLVNPRIFALMQTKQQHLSRIGLMKQNLNMTSRMLFYMLYHWVYRHLMIEI